MVFNKEIAIQNLQFMFRYLDRYYTKASYNGDYTLGPNQDLKKAAENIKKDLFWLPKYKFKKKKNVLNNFIDINRKKSYGDLCDYIVKNILPIWDIEKRGLNIKELVYSYSKIYDIILSKRLTNKTFIEYDCYILYLDLCRGVYKTL